MNILDFGESDIIAEKKYLLSNGNNENDNDNVQVLPWIEKYRPNTFNDIISHHDILVALEKMIKKKNLPHLMFYGPPGIGKTTTVLTCARKMYGENYKNMILELNGSEDRGINVVREQIKEFSVSRQFISNMIENVDNHVKLVILDEADSMTSDAQFALRRVIENYTYNVRFCIICNYDTKIISALKSRCMIFRFSPIPKQLHFIKIENICNLENVNITKDAIKSIVELADGDMRKSINIIQVIHTTHKFTDHIINKNDVFKQIGLPTHEEIQTFINIIFDKNIKLSTTIDQINRLKLQYGITTADILKQITEHLITIINTENTYNIVKILDILGNLENYMVVSYNDSLILGNIIACIKCNV
jgi:replication factor C subunit 3/5